MSGPSGDAARFVIVADARRRWPRSQKEAIVAELSGPAASVSAVARKYSIAPSLLFRWRRELGSTKPPTIRTEPAFVPVGLPAPASAHASSPRWAGKDGVIEIELVGGRRLRVDGSVDVNALRRMIEALER